MWTIITSGTEWKPGEACWPFRAKLVLALCELCWTHCVLRPYHCVAVSSPCRAASVCVSWWVCVCVYVHAGMRLCVCLCTCVCMCVCVTGLVWRQRGRVLTLT
jgi:hypothetical protein